MFILLTPLVSSIVQSVIPVNIIPVTVTPEAPELSVIVPEKSLIYPMLR
jgi:hypothetical protein